MNLFNNFFPPSVKTCISDAMYDFTLPSDGFSLTDPQRKFINKAFDRTTKFVFSPRQVHGDEIIVVDQALAKKPKLLMADAVITQVEHFSIAVRVADCLPLFLYDTEKNVIAAVHAGWKSTEQHITTKTIEKMVSVYGTDPKNIKAAIGPCIRPKVYEVGEDFSKHFKRNLIERNGKIYFDNPQENKDQLIAAGVLVKNIIDCDICSFSNPDYHSFRRDGEQSGRMLCAIMLV